MVTMTAGALAGSAVPQSDDGFLLLCFCAFFKSSGKWALFQILLVPSSILDRLYCCLQVYVMEIIGFQRRWKRVPWVRWEVNFAFHQSSTSSFNSLVTITFFIPYSLGKLAATLVIQKYPDNWWIYEFYLGLATGGDGIQHNFFF